jgi:hypothetical protein
MPRLHCEISSALDRVITRAKIRSFKTKGRVLNHFIKRAIEDKGEYKGGYPFGNDRASTATISNFSDQNFEATVPYREKWVLTSQTDFFRFALHHGASLWEHENPNEQARAKA